MKIALTFPGCHRRAGVERIMFECARFLASRDHDVHVFAGEWEVDETQSIRYHQVPIRRYPAHMRGASYKDACERLLARDRFDVMNSHGCVCPTGGVHWVQSVHRAWLQRSRQFRPALSLGRLKQRLNPLHPVLLKMEEEHFGQRAYRKVIATTEEVRADLHRLYSVPPEDVVVIPNGFSPSEFSPELRTARRNSMREKIGLAPDHIALLFVANELERKGYSTLLRALKEAKRSDIRLLVVGKADQGEVVRQATEEGVGDYVIPCGATQDVAQFHAACDVFVLPTQYEAFCLAILEALGSGLPVVTTTVPGARDAILPGRNGFTIDDPRDSSQLLGALEPLFDRQFRNEMAEGVADTVTQYQWPRVLARYEEVLLQHAAPGSADTCAS